MVHPKTTQKIGLLGGTFNPVHNGHLFLAEEARVQCQLDRVLFIPNRRPPHKDEPKVTAEIRYQMLLAATEKCPDFEVSRVELDREGRSYTTDTLNSFPEEDELTFICGADAFNSDWYRLEDVLRRLTHLILANRAGFPFELPAQLQALPKELQKKISMMEFPDISISSSDIRSRIKEKKAHRFLIPEPVYRIITESELYS